MINTLFVTIVAVEFICQCFPLALANICPWPQVPFFQISVKKSKLNHPQYLLGLSRALFPTTFFEIAVYIIIIIITIIIIIIIIKVRHTL